MRPLLTREAFRELVQSQTSASDEETVDREYEGILGAYGEKQRHYHTMAHIHTMWAAWAAWDPYWAQYDTSGAAGAAIAAVDCYSDKVVKFAILFHEYVPQQCECGSLSLI